MKESRTLEFKQDVTNSVLKTVSAFANFGTGTILFGVDDSGKTVGVSDPDKVRLDIENRVNDSIRPKPEYSISVNRKTNVISLDVQEGKYKPYLYKGKAYRRSDTATLEVDQVELRRLTLEGENLYYEGLPCGTDKLTFNYFESKLDEKLEIKILTEDILRTFGFINDDKSYNNAAAIFADSNQFCGMDIARFGDSISEIQDREMISGASILKQYDGAVIMFKRYYQYETIIVALQSAGLYMFLRYFAVISAESPGSIKNKVYSFFKDSFMFKIIFSISTFSYGIYLAHYTPLYIFKWISKYYFPIFSRMTRYSYS